MTAYNVVSAASLVAGQPEDISIILANLQAIATVINGGIDNGNINAAAAIALSKLQGYPTDATKFARGDGTWAAPPAQVQVVPGYGTSIPGTTPTDGQEFILVDSLTNPSYQWFLRYNAGSSSPYKWEYVGGTHFGVFDFTLSNIPNTLTDIPGATITLPRAGDYMVDWGGDMYATSVGAYTQVCLKKGAAAVNMAEMLGDSAPQGAGATNAHERKQFLFGASAGMVLKLQGVCNASTGIIRYGFLFVTPRRLA